MRGRSWPAIFRVLSASPMLSSILSVVRRSGTSLHRDMARDPAVPHAIGHVELACRSPETKERAGKAKLVREFVAAQMHRFLVEGHEHDAIDHSCPRQLKCPAQALNRGSPAGRRNPGHRNFPDAIDRQVEMQDLAIERDQSRASSAACLTSILDPAWSSPRANTSGAPMTTRFAQLRTSSSLRSLCKSSGPMPPGSPWTRAMVFLVTALPRLPVSPGSRQYWRSRPRDAAACGLRKLARRGLAARTGCHCAGQACGLAPSASWRR